MNDEKILWKGVNDMALLEIKGKLSMLIDEYENGVHITGIGTYQGNPDDIDLDKNVYYNVHYEIDEYDR